VFCRNGIILELKPDVRMEPFSIHDERSTELWINTGIVAIPLFKIDVSSSSECVGFGSKFSRMETDYKVESGELFGPTCLLTHEDFGH